MNNERHYTIHSRAPSRIGIGGGGTDLPSFFNEYGGAVLNVAVNLFSYTRLKMTGLNHSKVISHDWNIEREFDDLELEFSSNVDSNIDLVKATMKEAGLSPKNGYELMIHSTSPKNSGLAGSSALSVSILSALFNEAGKPMIDRDAISKSAYNIERNLLHRPGGYQDQYAAVFGGFNFIELNKDQITISPLRMEEDLVCEWHSSMMLFETTLPRQCYAHEIESKKEDDVRAGGKSVDCLRKMKSYAYEMKRHLISGNVPELGELLDLSWEEKKKLPGVSSKYIDHIYTVAKDAGAYGGKLAGAGGGGFIFLLCDLADRKNIVTAMEKEGCKFVNFDFDFEGMVSWRAEIRRGSHR